MPYQLVYLPKSGNKNYWTKNNRFTHKLTQHLFWETPALIQNALPALKQKNPTLFTNKRDDRFYIYDDTGQLISRVIQLPGLGEQTTNKTKPNIKLTAKAYYAITTSIDGVAYYYDSTKGKNGRLVTPGDGNIRFWKHSEFEKVVATAQNLCQNKNFLAKGPILRPDQLKVINVRSGQVVWPLALNSQSSAPTATVDKVTALLDEVREQFHGHLGSAKGEEFVNDENEQATIPTVDMDKFAASKLFAALCYLVEAVTQRSAFDKLLNIYDKELLQDYLHYAELTDVHQIDSTAFVQSLQQMRVARRRIKDICVLLQTIDENLDSSRLLRQLLGHQSLHNQYHFRNHELGDQLLGMTASSQEK